MGKISLGWLWTFGPMALNQEQDYIWGNLKKVWAQLWLFWHLVLKARNPKGPVLTGDNPTQRRIIQPQMSKLHPHWT